MLVFRSSYPSKDHVYDNRQMLLKVEITVCMLCIYPSLQIFINNEFVNSVSGKTFPTINPVDETKITDIQEGDKVGGSGNTADA